MARSNIQMYFVIFSKTILVILWPFGGVFRDMCGLGNRSALGVGVHTIF